jgi:Cd(II)/Pb(II)-responsive transcriptional regulator
MKIGKLAEVTGCKVETIRYYEKQGLLPEPERTEGNYRDYGPAELARLSFIRNCRNLDMALTEVRELLHFLDSPREDCTGVNDIIDRHVGHVQRRIRELTTLRDQLVELREQCLQPDQAERCSILHGLSHNPGRRGLRPAAHPEGTH